jgi:hypothetical protein
MADRIKNSLVMEGIRSFPGVQALDDVNLG